MIMTQISCIRCGKALEVPTKEVAQRIGITRDHTNKQARAWGKVEGICAKNTSGHWRWCEACFPDAFRRHGVGRVSGAPYKPGQLPSAGLRQQTFPTREGAAFRDAIELSGEKPIGHHEKRQDKESRIDVPVEKVVEKTIVRYVDVPVERTIEKVVNKTQYGILALVGSLFLGLGYVISDGQPRAYLEGILWPQDRSGSETSLAPRSLKPQP